MDKFQFLPREIILNHITKFIPKDFFRVDKAHYFASFNFIIRNDPDKLNKNVWITGFMSNILEVLILHNNIKLVKLLLSHPGVNPGKYNNYSLRIAIENNRVEIVRLLIADPRVNPACSGELFFIATRKNNLEIVQILSTDIRVTEHWRYLAGLSIAAEIGSLQLVQFYLLDTRIDNDRINSALYNTAFDKEVINLLISDKRLKK